MFKLGKLTILCTKWADFKCDSCYRSQNSWTGSCSPWWSISACFKTVWRHVSHCWILVPYLSETGFQLLKSLWLSLTYFSFNDAPNVLYRWKNWTASHPSCPYHLHLYTNRPSEMLAFELNAENTLLFSPEDTASVITNKNVKFGLIWLQNTFTLWNSPF